MASRAKQIYWAVRRAWTMSNTVPMQQQWETLTGDRELPDDHFETLVYFADGPVNLYQLRQWWEPLRELDKESPVLLLCRSASAALALWEESPVPVAYVARIEDVERLVNRQRLRLALYVNHHQRNFQMLRFIDLLHVYISHGESDKHYMVSGQIKAYDFTFIAGDAAEQRLGKFLLNYDVPTRTRRIGRPQLDATDAAATPVPDDDRAVVLYVPTWEGDRPSMGYGSLPSHGVALVKALTSSPRHRVIVRPHPRTGIYSEEQRSAQEQVQAIIDQANLADPSAQHLYDQTPTLSWQLQVADVAISDVSAAAIDWLATGKPIIVTHPAEPDAVLPETGYLAQLDLLTADDADSIIERIDALAHDEEATATRLKWTTFYFGDTTPGVATRLWLEACRDVIAICNSELADRGFLESEAADQPDSHRPVDVLAEAELDS